MNCGIRFLKGYTSLEVIFLVKRGRTSWAWSSLVEGKDVLLRVANWQVGDGENTGKAASSHQYLCRCGRAYGLQMLLLS